MRLRADVETLIEALESVASGLTGFQGSADHMTYAKHLRRRLLPLIEDLRDQVAAGSGRSGILRTMAEIKEVMSEVSAAATKGEMAICQEGILDTFWRLSTIFQEQRHRDEHL